MGTSDRDSRQTIFVKPYFSVGEGPKATEQLRYYSRSHTRGNGHMLGKRLRRLRRRQGWSQAKLAEEVGLTQGYIAHLEHGRRTSPTLAVLVKVARVLRVSMTELTGA